MTVFSPSADGVYPRTAFTREPCDHVQINIIDAATKNDTIVYLLNHVGFLCRELSWSHWKALTPSHLS